MATPPLILVVDDATHVVNALAVKLQSAGHVFPRAHGDRVPPATLDRVTGPVTRGDVEIQGRRNP
ncbi:MAG: hypothetical protein R3C45_03285 [Phycisphaerales bacterium]